MNIEFLKNTTQDDKKFKKGQQLGVTLAWGRELISKGVAFDVDNPLEAVEEIKLEPIKEEENGN